MRKICLKWGGGLRAGAHYTEQKGSEMNEPKCLPFLFSELFRNRELYSDPRRIVRRSSLIRIQCLNKNLMPEVYYLNI